MITVEEMNRIEAELIEVLDEMYSSMGGVMQTLSEEYYTSIVADIIASYEASSINVTTMFEGPPIPNIFNHFEVIRRAGSVVERIRTHFTGTSDTARRIQTSLSNSYERIQRLSKSQDIISEFAQKMESCYSFLGTFDIGSKEYVDVDKGQFKTKVKYFWDSVHNVEAYRRIYESLQRVKVKIQETSVFEQSFRNGVAHIVQESTRLAKGLG